MKRFLTAIVAVAAMNFAFAQQQPCGFDAVHQQTLKSDPDYARNVEINEATIQRIIQERQKKGTKADPGVVTIPIVFHVIHKGEAVGTGTNISDAQIQSAIDGMNIQYRNKKADGSVFDAAGTDLKMEFCLAQKDPNGLPTTGINRINGSSVANYTAKGIVDNGGAGTAGVPANETAVKNLSRWDNTKYYNVWIVVGINGENPTGGGTQGYAYFPGAGATVDGTVILYNACGYCPGNNCAGFNLKSFALDNGTMVHEIGHAFSLYHTFEGGSSDDGNGTAGTCPPAETSANCTTKGDRVCDTDPHKGNLQRCAAVGSTNSCTGGTYNVNIARNYMNYTQCSPLIFTPGQRDRVTAAFQPGAGRYSLTLSDGCDAVFPYDAALKTLSQPAGFYCDPNVGGIVTIKNTGQNTLTSFDIQIIIDGSVAGTHTWTGSLGNNKSTTINITPVIVAPGVHTYKLKVVNNSLNNFSQTDGLASNDEVSTTFEVLGDGVISTLTVTDYAVGDNFVVKNATSGATLLTITMDDTLASFTRDICLPKGCYNFVITDVEFRPINFVGGLVPTFELKDDHNFVIASGLTQRTGTANDYGKPKSETVSNKCLPYNPGYLDADFTADKFVIEAGSSVSFTDLTTVSAGSPAGTPGASMWEWDFGDLPTDNVKNPIHQYNTPGVYTVRLIADNGIAADTATKVHYIRVVQKLTGCDLMDNFLPAEAPTTATTVAGTAGHFPGPNSLTPQVYAERFLAGSLTNLKSIDVFFTTLYASSPTSKVNFTIYSGSATAPGPVLLNWSVPMSSLITGNYNTITLPIQIAVNDFFYVAVNMATNADTIVLGAASFRGKADFSNTAFMLAGGNWTSVDKAFTEASATSLAIRAKLTFKPKAKFESDVIQTCVGKAINYDAGLSTSTTTYQWTFEGGSPVTSGAVKPAVTYNSEGVKKVTLVAVGGCGETDTIRKTITIAPPPSIDVTGVNEVCKGTNGSATAVASGGSGDYTFSWNTTPVQTSAKATGIPAGSYTVKLVDSKCGTISKSVTLINEDKLPDFAVTQNNTTCGISNGNAEAKPVGGSGTYFYKWTSANDPNFIQTSKVASNLDAGTYTVEVSDGTTCAPAVKTITIAGSVGVNGSVTASSSSVCEGQAVSLKATGGDNYVWNNGNVNFAFSDSINITPAASTEYTVRISSKTGCFIDIKKRVNVTPSPEAFASVSNQSNAGYGDNCTVDIAKGGFAYFSSSGSLGYAYKWTFGDNDSTDIKNPYHKYTKVGTYWVYLTVYIDGCFTKDSVLVNVINSSGSGNGITQYGQSMVSIYPNPANQSLSIMNPEKVEMKSIVIIDVLGKIVANFGKSQLNSELNVSSIPSGSYLMKIETESGTSVQKLEILH